MFPLTISPPCFDLTLRLSVSLSTFHKKRGFCEKKIPLPPPTKSFALTQLFARYFRQKASFLPKEKIVSPYYIPSHKKFRPDSTFCKVLSAKSVVFTERKNRFPLIYPLRLFFRKGHQNYYAKSKQLIVSHIRLNFVFPYGIPSDKTAPPNSPFCKVLFIKSVVFMKSDILIVVLPKEK